MVRAVVAVEPRVLEVREFEPVAVGADDGVLEPELAGICGTDYKTYTGAVSQYPRPLVLGHEILGRIGRVGQQAAARWGVQPGDRVVVESSVPCWSCEWCWSGAYRYCPDRRGYGTSTPCTQPPYLWGAMGEEMYLAPGSILHRIDAAVPAEAAVLAGGVVANGIRWAVEVGEARPGVSTVVRGAGPQGLACAALAVRAGSDPVILLGRTADRERLAIGRELGVTHTHEVDGLDVPALVRDLAGGRGAHLVIDAAGAAGAFDEDIDLLRPQGRLVWAGLTGAATTAALHLDPIVWKEIDVRGVFTKPSASIDASIRLLESGVIPFERILTHSYDLEQAEDAILAIGGEGATYPLKAAIRTRAPAAPPSTNGGRS